LHSACLDEYCAKHARHDAHGRIISQPQIESMTPTPPRGKCILCGGWLAEVAISFNERAARALASKPAGFSTGLTVEEATALIELRSAVDRAHERYKGREKV
jgi:hypothetical protein